MLFIPDEGSTSESSLPARLTKKSSSSIKIFRLDPANPPKFTEAELAAIDAAAERGENDPNSGYYDDCPELDEEFFRTARRVYPQALGKTRVTVRLDTDVLEWLKSYGNRYQTRLNSLLRLAMQADKKATMHEEKV